MRESRLLPVILGGVGGLVGGTIFVVVGGIAGQSGYLTLTSVRIVLVAAIYDAVVAPLVFPFVRWANHDPGLRLPTLRRAADPWRRASDPQVRRATPIASSEPTVKVSDEACSLA